MKELNQINSLVLRALKMTELIVSEQDPERKNRLLKLQTKQLEHIKRKLNVLRLRLPTN